MIYAKSHRLFLIDVLARVQRRNEVLAMQMLRRSDQHRVDALVVEQIPVIEISLGVRRNFLCIFEPFGINIRERHKFRIRTSHRLAHDLHSPVARPDNSQPDPLVRPENTGRRRQCPRQAGSDLANKIAS